MSLPTVCLGSVPSPRSGPLTLPHSSDCETFGHLDVDLIISAWFWHLPHYTALFSNWEAFVADTFWMDRLRWGVSVLLFSSPNVGLGVVSPRKRWSFWLFGGCPSHGFQCLIGVWTGSFFVAYSGGRFNDVFRWFDLLFCSSRLEFLTWLYCQRYGVPVTVKSWCVPPAGFLEMAVCSFLVVVPLYPLS